MTKTAILKFFDEETPVLADSSRRKTVIDAALDLAEEFDIARIEFVRSVVRSCGPDAEQRVTRQV